MKSESNLIQAGDMLFARHLSHRPPIILLSVRKDVIFYMTQSGSIHSVKVYTEIDLLRSTWEETWGFA
jgi:hypothetical protein